MPYPSYGFCAMALNQWIVLVEFPLTSNTPTKDYLLLAMWACKNGGVLIGSLENVWKPSTPLKLLITSDPGHFQRDANDLRGVQQRPGKLLNGKEEGHQKKRDPAKGKLAGTGWLWANFCLACASRQCSGTYFVWQQQVQYLVGTRRAT